MNDIYFTVAPALKESAGWNWAAIGVIVSICASMIALVGLVVTWFKISRDNKHQRSLFYLDQMKSYFANAVSLLSECKNNNVKWHQAIESLKITDELKRYLTDESHKHIYVIEYMNTAFSIVDVINNIHDFKFYYGLQEYKNKSSTELFAEANPLSLEKNHFRIAPDALLALSVFIDKANRAFHDLSKNTNKNEIFASNYFKENLKNHKSVSSISKSTTLKVIYDYLSNFNIQHNDRLKMKAEAEFV